MFNILWPMMIIIASCAAVVNDKVEAVTAGILIHASGAIQLVIGLVGVMSLWLGLVKVAENAGAVDWLVLKLKPIIKPLFPDVPKEHPSLGLITFSIVGNMLGLNNASTPLAIKSMQSLQTLNPSPTVATNAMCLFMVINSSSVQLIPATAMAALSKAGSSNPSQIVITGLIATAASTFTAVVTCLLLQSRVRYQAKP